MVGIFIDGDLPFVILALLIIIIRLAFDYFAAAPPSIVQKIRKNYNLNVAPNEEKEIEIKGIYMYPIRGVKGF